MNEFITRQTFHIRKITFGWNLFWWNYHLNRAREHDSRNEFIEPGWRDVFQKAKL